MASLASLNFIAISVSWDKSQTFQLGQQRKDPPFHSWKALGLASERNSASNFSDQQIRETAIQHRIAFNVMAVQYKQVFNWLNVIKGLKIVSQF